MHWWEGKACKLIGAAMQAARTKKAVPLVQAARRAVLLSGTPALNRPCELLQQVSSHSTCPCTLHELTPFLSCCRRPAQPASSWWW